MTNYYSLIPVEGFAEFEDHRTLRDASKRCIDAIDELRGEWPENVDGIECGRLVPIASARTTWQHEAGDGTKQGEYALRNGYDYVCDYALRSNPSRLRRHARASKRRIGAE